MKNQTTVSQFNKIIIIGNSCSGKTTLCSQTQKQKLSNATKINLHSVFTIFRYTSLKSLVLAPLSLRFSPRLSKNGFDIIEDLFSPHY